MVINSSGKSPFEIRDSAGKEFKEIYDIQGRLLFKNWNEMQGSLPLNFTSRGDYLKDYRIYGNTIQDGTPTPENPVEVRGVGEYDAELNGYKIPVTVSNGTNSVTTPVYIGSEPLHKIRDYADYVDFKRGVVVRRIKKLVLTRGEAWNSYGSTASGVGASVVLPAMLVNSRTNGFCTHFIPQITPASSAIDGITFGASNNTLYITFSVKAAKALNLTNTANVKTWLAAQYAAGTPVTIWYVLAEPEEELLENLLPIQTIRGTNILTVGTTVQPSEMYIKGKIKPIGGNENG